MSTLRSALDELRDEDLRALSDAALGADIEELERASRILEAERSRRLVEFERRNAHAADGHLSAAAWLAHRYGLSRRSAEAAVRRARTLEQMPEVARAYAEGEVSASAVEVLGRAQEAAPEAFAHSEEALVEAARDLSYPELRRVAETWRQAADPAGALEEEDRRFERRSLDLCPDPGGMVRVSGELDAEDGAQLITAIRAQIDAEVRAASGPDPRTPTQRRADALGGICRAWLARCDRPTVGGERPHVVVTLDVETLLEGSGRLASDGRSAGASGQGRSAELTDTGEITPETARRLACDADLTRVITGPGSEPLELGRRTKVVPPGLRRALAVRDRGCAFPGCGRPPGWCDAHHVRHWADGGQTGLANLVLLCRPHHRTIHRGFRVEMVRGHPVFTRPDGTVLTGRSPPGP